MVRRIEFETLQKRWQGGIPLDDVIRLLEVKTEELVSRLVKAKLLAWQNDAGINKASLKITPESLGNLFDKLHIHPASSWMMMETVRLQQLVENGMDVVTVLQRVVDGDLASLWFGGGLYEVQVSQHVWEQLSQPKRLQT
jgi:hypothetical protein